MTKTLDSDDGMCDADCSLREAIGASNAAPGAVLVPAGTYPLTRAGVLENLNATGDLDLTAGMGLYGAGMNATTIDGMTLDRVIDLCPIAGSIQCTNIVGDLGLINGRATAGMQPEPIGGGLRNGLAGTNQYLALQGVRLSGNGAGTSGGGAFISISATIRDSRVSGNFANFSGGGLALLYTPQRVIEVSGSTISGNTSQNSGGGIRAQGAIQVLNSTISGNSAQMNGGGIYASGGVLSVASSTIVRNDAGGTNPFAVDAGGGVRMDSGGAGNHRIIGSVIAGNILPASGASADCVLFDRGLDTRYNHVQAPGSCGFVGTGDAVGSDPGIDPALADNGGPTPTHRPFPGSAAIDGGDPAGCVDFTGVTLEFDQRGAGFARVVGPACDKGAFESPVFVDLIHLDGFESP